jgi:hypothetical protein
METNTLPLEKELEPIFTKSLPAFPEEIKELLVKIAPYLAIVGVIFGGIAILFGGLATILTLFSFSGAGIWLGLSMIFLIVVVALEGLSIPGLMNRKRQGWKFSYYAVLVSAVQSLLSLSIFGIISAAITIFIGMWILFQIREKYS